MVQCPWHPLGMHAEVVHWHWRQSALNSAGALQGRSGEFRGISTPFYTIKPIGEGIKVGVHMHLLHPLVRRLCQYYTTFDL